MAAGIAAKVFDTWRAAFLVAPPLAIVMTAILVIYVREPPRGHADGATNLESTDYLTDVKSILKVKSFVFTSFGLSVRP
jgi:predicted MFS family arabinose efflux permease